MEIKWPRPGLLVGATLRRGKELVLQAVCVRVGASRACVRASPPHTHTQDTSNERAGLGDASKGPPEKRRRVKKTRKRKMTPLSSLSTEKHSRIVFNVNNNDNDIDIGLTGE